MTQFFFGLFTPFTVTSYYVKEYIRAYGYRNEHNHHKLLRVNR